MGKSHIRNDKQLNKENEILGNDAQHAASVNLAKSQR